VAATPERPGSDAAIAVPGTSHWVGHAFTIAVGVLGWLVVIGLPLTGWLPIDERTPALPIILFVAVILGARALAFRLTEGSVLSLDSAYYVAAALSVGSAEAGRLVALALTLDASARLWNRIRKKQQVDGWFAELGYVLYFGGMSGGLLLLCGWAFGADHADRSNTVEVTLKVIAIASSLLASHYTVQGIRQRLLGQNMRQYLHQLAIPGIASEASLMPIGAVLVLLYDPLQPLGFMLLSLTYLLINFVFARLSRARHELQERVHDLEILNATGRRFSAALQLEELVETVARETCKAIPEAEAITFVHRRAGRDSELVMDGFDRRTDKFFRHGIAPGEGAAGWVITNANARRIDDLGDTEFGGDGIRSWLGVPMFMYGDCDGVVAVQSSRAAAFTAEHQRLLESLALQIAAALQNAHLYELAMVDGLTQLFVRRYFDARIEEEIERSRRYGSPFSVVMLDVDNFKKLNDEFGHLVGDRVLRAIANVIKAQMRGVDTAARYGGEEMAVILPRTEMVGAYNLAERIREAIADLRITTDPEGDIPARSLSVTASLGIAAFPESKASDGEDLVRRADRALYRAKKTGKNRVELFWTDDPSGLHKISQLGGPD
jgi:diguanylate cyclase (GGDEF)-like protein